MLVSVLLIRNTPCLGTLCQFEPHGSCALAAVASHAFLAVLRPSVWGSCSHLMCYVIAQALTRANQQSVDKMTEYKERNRGLRAACGDKDKQLDLAKRTIERLSGQCNAMEVRACIPLTLCCGQTRR